MEILDSKKFKTSLWNGGKTVEMFIFPSDASYQKGDFLFRLSSATIEDENTVFTVLPNVKRFLTPIDNTLVLTHTKDGQSREVTLDPLKVDVFDGGEETLCVGTGQDVNLMIKDGSQGKMITFSGGKVIFSGDFLFIYALEDITAGKNEETLIKKGEVAISNEKGKYSISGESVLICVELPK
ncbi:MAG TPA: HutD family protein [Eubacteriales bacterium]|nr:HutD family protein [Eubacteriales bacterium]